MSTDELYARLSASTLARIYSELESSPMHKDMAEARKVREAGIINAGQGDFDALVDEINVQEFNQ